jgi:hypothetical protein
MSLERHHLERIAALGLLVSPQYPSHGVCPNGYRVFKPCADGKDTCGRFMMGRADLLPQGVQHLSREDGDRMRRLLGPTAIVFAVEGAGCWVREEAGRWLVYDGDVAFPAGIRSTFRREFDSPEKAVQAIREFFERGGR